MKGGTHWVCRTPEMGGRKGVEISVRFVHVQSSWLSLAMNIIIKVIFCPVIETLDLGQLLNLMTKCLTCNIRVSVWKKSVLPISSLCKAAWNFQSPNQSNISLSISLHLSFIRKNGEEFDTYYKISLSWCHLKDVPSEYKSLKRLE